MLHTITKRLEKCIDINIGISEVDHYTWIFTSRTFGVALEITFLLEKYFFLQMAYELLPQSRKPNKGGIGVGVGGRGGGGWGVVLVIAREVGKFFLKEINFESGLYHLLLLMADSKFFYTTFFFFKKYLENFLMKF